LLVGECNVNLRKPLSAHKKVRETSLFTYAVRNKVRKSQTLVSFRSKSGKVKPSEQRWATVAIGDDDGRVVSQEWNRDRIA